MLVRREVRRHPVQDHADAGLVQVVDEVHQVLRAAVTGRRREVAGGLVAPGTVERVLHDRQQFDVGEAERLHVGREQRRQLAVGQRAVTFLHLAPPRTQVHLVHCHRRVERIGASAPGHPVVIVPHVVQRPHARGGAWRRLAAHGERIGLVHPVAVVTRDDVELVLGADRRAGDEAFPDAGLVVAGLQRMGVRVPVVEIADHRRPRGVGRPQREAHALATALAARVGAEFLVQPGVGTLAEQVDIVFRQAMGLGIEGGRVGHSALLCGRSDTRFATFYRTHTRRKFQTRRRGVGREPGAGAVWAGTGAVRHYGQKNRPTPRQTDQ